MTIAVAEYQGEAAEWNTFAAANAAGTFCHWYGWKAVIEKTFGHECRYLAVREGDALAAILPLVWVQSRIFGRYLVSMPFLNYGGPLGAEGSVRALTAAAVDLARQRNAKLLELRSVAPLAIDLPVSHRKLTVVLDLPSTSEALWKVLSHGMRNKIRKPQKEGVEVRIGPAEAEPFWAIFSRHMRDLGTPTLPFAWFAAVRETFRSDVVFACAYHKGVAIAGGCGFATPRDFELTWSSALNQYRDLRANVLLHYSFMEEAVRRGSARFNFGRSTPGSGTHEFKLQWSSRDQELWWYQHTKAADAATPSPTDSAYAWGPRLWKKLPLVLANRLGPRIVRYLP
jgi:serine/alanine adding enzyme